MALSVEFANDSSYYAYKMTYKELSMRFIFPRLLIIDNSDIIDNPVIIDKDLDDIINPIYIASLPFVNSMTLKQRTCLMLCSIHFYIYTQEKYNNNNSITDNVNFYMLIFFFFIDASLHQRDYNHLNWGYCTYNRIVDTYVGDHDIFEIMTKVSSKMIFYQNNMKRISDTLSLNLSMRKIRMIETHTKATIILVDTKSGDKIMSNVIDSFLYGIISFMINDVPIDYSLFGGPLIILKDIDDYIHTHPLTPYEMAFFLNIFNMHTRFCSEYAKSVIENARRIKSACDHVNGEYMNGIMMCYLELYYFKNVTRTLGKYDVYDIVEEMCAVKNLSIRLSLTDWEIVYGRSLSKYMDMTKNDRQMKASTSTSNIGRLVYNMSIFEKIKSHIVSYLNILSDETVSKQEIDACDNELKLIVLFLTGSDRSSNIKTVFISLIIYFIQIYGHRINNAYIHCMTMYLTTEKWHKKIYQITGYKDANFIEAISRMKNDCNVMEIGSHTDVTMSSKIHFSFENSVYVYIYLKQMMEIFLRTVGMTIREIHRFRIIDFSGIKGHGGIMEEHVKSCISKVRMHIRLGNVDDRIERRYTNMTLNRLMNDDVDDYAYREKKQTGNLMDTLYMIHRDNQRYKRAISRHGCVF